MPRTFKLIFLEKYGRTLLLEKEKELLDRDFGYRNIDELVDAFNNTKTNKEFDKLFNKISNKLDTLKKFVNIVLDTAEKKNKNNVIKGVDFAFYFTLC